MRTVLHSVCFVLSGVIMLSACDAPKKKATFNLYELTPSTGNDSYYTPPTTMGSCSDSIQFSPSCGGI